jgi:hypothetical protein
VQPVEILPSGHGNEAAGGAEQRLSPMNINYRIGFSAT